MCWTWYCSSVCNTKLHNRQIWNILLLINIPISVDKRITVFSSPVSLISFNNLFLLFQEYARKALDFIWEKRQRSSNLVGVTINIHTGDWVRKGMWYSGLELVTRSGFGQGEMSLHHLSHPQHLLPRLYKNINGIGQWSYIIAVLGKPVTANPAVLWNGASAEKLVCFIAKKMFSDSL